MKGAFTITSSMLIIFIYIVLVFSVLLWGIPIIEKNQDHYLLEESEKFLFSIDKKLENVVKLGGTEEFSFNLPGKIYIDADKDVILFQVKTIGYKYYTKNFTCLSENCSLSKDTSDEDTFMALKAEVYTFQDKAITLFILSPRNTKLSNNIHTIDIITPKNETLIGGENSRYIIRNLGESLGSSPPVPGGGKTVKTKIEIKSY
jgi:hypothetical protein